MLFFSLVTGSRVVAEEPAPSGEQVLGNFGLPLVFSSTKMVRDAAPGSAWAEYATGRWTSAAVIPADAVAISPFHVLNRRVSRDLSLVLEDAATRSAQARKGTPLQQVGDFYASGMDVEKINALGVQPFEAVVSDLGPLATPAERGRAFARLSMLAGEPVMAEFAVGTDIADRTRYAIYLGDADLTLISNDIYLNPDYEFARKALLDFIGSSLVLRGLSADEARASAQKILAWETRIAAAKLTPVEKADPTRRFVPMPMAQVRELFSNVDLDAFLGVYGGKAPDRIIVVEGEALAERNALLGEMSPADLRLFLEWGLLIHTLGYLTEEFQVPNQALSQAILGQSAMPPRETLVTLKLQGLIGHPISQLYIARHFSAESKARVEALVARIRATFRDRLESNTWLTPPTREYAIQKLDRADILVGYPARWIDYSPVEIRRDDYYGNALRTNEYLQRRQWARLGGPVVVDRFSIAGSTLPIDTNAAFNAANNGIEIPAAFLQPPFYSPEQDVVANTCAMGAVIGHELTHGFDTRGRLYDADGRLRDWWTKEDAENFLAQADTLIAQADSFEVLPGLHINGKLTVGENMADIGGVNFAFQALEKELQEHPEDDVVKDGLTPRQRCFLAWAQLWPTRTREGALRQTVATDPHADGNYRVEAPMRHVDGFFEAFELGPDDPMWIAPDRRSHIW
ncbi:M13 family metallopeptidase [Haliea sp. E17]|uniref:M13 family metallopeptidase n=1 Tax=Haliea sp. E17 TaxID=3401576 RepID=UPI003AABCC6D